MLSAAVNLWFNLDFLLLITLDFLILYSLVFATLYAAYICAASFFAARGGFRPRPSAMPALLLVSLAVLFTPARPFLAARFAEATNLLCLVVFERTGYDTVAELLKYVWIGGAVSSAALVLFRVLRLSRLLSRLPERPHDPALAKAGAAALRKKPASVKTSPDGLAVASWSGVSDFLLVPEWFGQSFTDDERSCVYLHELIHLSRKDSWKFVAASFLSCVFWFNPAMHAAMRRFRVHVEIACDRAVLERGGIDPARYAALLAKMLRAGSPLAPGLSGTYREVRWRLNHLFGERGLLPGGARRLALAGAFLVSISLYIAFGPEPPPPPGGLFPPGTVQWQGVLATYTQVTVTK